MSASDIVDALDARAGAVTDVIDAACICDRAICVLTSVGDTSISGALYPIIAIAVLEAANACVGADVTLFAAGITELVIESLAQEASTSAGNVDHLPDEIRVHSLNKILEIEIHVIDTGAQLCGKVIA